MSKRLNPPKFDINQVVFFIQNGIIAKTTISAVFVSQADVQYALNGIQNRLNECYLYQDLSILDDKKDRLLKEAIQKYPKGTRIRGFASTSDHMGRWISGDVYTVIGDWEVLDYEDVVAMAEEDNYRHIYIRRYGKWEDVL